MLQNWVYQPAIQKAVDAAVEQLRAKPGPTIAFHARGGDKREEDIECALPARPQEHFLLSPCSQSVLTSCNAHCGKEREGGMKCAFLTA